MLTDIAIKKLKPRPVRYEIPDGKGLYVVVHESGKKSFAVRFRVNGTSKKLTLPKGLSLAEARARAAAAILEVHKGSDPTATKRRDREAQEAAAANTFRAIAEDYLKRDGKELRSAEWQRRLLQRLVYPRIGDMPIDTIRRKTIKAMLDKIEDGSGAPTAQSALAAVRRIMNWHAVGDDDYVNPIVRGMGRIKPSERARSRVLSDTELRAIWKATEQRDDPFAAFVRFLLLTAARRNEAARMTWGEIAPSGDWTLPAARNKVKVDLTRPLSAAALAVLKARPRVDGNPFVFTYRRGPLAGFAQHKSELAAASGTTGWTLHDLRRTARSLMSRAKVNADHAERCLGHIIGGVRGTYDRHDYLAEMRHAYEQLATEIDTIVNPPADNVMRLRG